MKINDETRRKVSVSFKLSIQRPTVGCDGFCGECGAKAPPIADNLEILDLSGLVDDNKGDAAIGIEEGDIGDGTIAEFTFFDELGVELNQVGLDLNMKAI